MERRLKMWLRPMPLGWIRPDVTVLTKYERYDEVGGTWQTGSSYNERSNVVEVKVNYPFRLVTGGLVLAQNTIQVSSTSRMIIAN